MTFQHALNKPKHIINPISPETKCYFRVTGGLGDILICAGVANSIPAEITLGVPKYVIPLLESAGVRCVDHKSFSDYSDFDIIGNFDGCFATNHNLLDIDYYEAAALKINYKVGTLKFNLSEIQSNYDYVIHPSSSNPNRNWGAKNWIDLAWSLALKGNSVAFLGTEKETGFTDERMGILKLSDISSDLLWQAKVLRSSLHFIGNDSGFAHLAGLLGVNGRVLFFNTHPKNVISHYPTLSAVCGFSESEEPTGNLNPLDEKSSNFRNNITLADICTLYGVDPVHYATNVPLPSILIIGSDETRKKFFESHLKNDFTFGEGDEITLNLDKNQMILKGIPHSFVGGPYDVQRFLYSKGV
jgi:Glycosyltransferase family 9 (heptosyltransferase)